MDQRIRHHRYNHSLDFKHPKNLNKNAIILLVVSALFTVAVALSNTFVNVYLWKMKKDFLLIGWFNFYQYLGTTFLFMLAGRLAKIFDRVFILRLGIFVLAIFYLMVLLLGASATSYYLGLGVLLGFGQAFYWYAFNTMYFEITEPHNRDTFNGWNGLLTSIPGIIAPFISGWLISRSEGMTGYRIIFILSLIIFFVAVLTSLLFYKRKNEGTYQLKQVFLITIKKKNWRNLFIGMFAQGVREGVIIFLIGLLIYISTNNEFSLGSYTMIISGVAAVTYFFAGRWMKKRYRNLSMMIGTIMMAVVVIPLFLNVTYTTLLIYGVGTSLFAPLYFIPLTSKTFDLIGVDEETVNHRGEYIVVRETGLNLGRVAITLIFIGFIKYIGSEHLRYILMISGSMQIITWLFVRKINVYSADRKGVR